MYVSAAELTRALFFWCVDVFLSLSFFPRLLLQFFPEAFSQAGKHNYSLHVLNLIGALVCVLLCYALCNVSSKLTVDLCFSRVCLRWCFFARPLKTKGLESNQGDLNLCKLLRKLTLNSWFGFLYYWGLKRMTSVDKVYLNMNININIKYGGVYWVILNKSKFNSWKVLLPGSQRSRWRALAPEGDMQEWCQSQAQV